MTILFLSILIRKFRIWQQERQLRYQQALAVNGIGIRTELLDVIPGRKIFDQHVRFCLLVRMRVNGKMVCRKVYTIVERDAVLYRGEKVHIRYNPGHCEHVLLCNKTNH